MALISVYSNSTQDVVNPLLYQGFIEETVELLELDQAQFTVSPFNYVQLFKYFCYFVSLLLLLLFVCLFYFYGGWSGSIIFDIKTILTLEERV